MAAEDWASLEQGLLHDIFLRFDDDANAAHFRGVCSQWRAAAAGGTGTAFVPRPWLVVYAPEQRRHAWLRPSRRRRRERRRFKRVDGEMSLWLERGGNPAAVWLISVSRGWVAMKHGESHLLRDPVSGDEVPLPSCDPRYELTKVILTDDPLSAASGEWTAFAFLSRHQHNVWPHERRVVFCRAGDDGWTFLDKAIQAQRYRGLEFFQGRAYVLLSNYTVAVGDVVSRSLIATCVDLSHAYHWRHDELLEVSCLVSCGDDLLFVQVTRQVVLRRSCFAFLAGHHHYRDHRRRRFTSKVYKLEFAADGSGVPVGFTKVESIGDYALFVSRRSHAFALPASGFPGVEPNRIYHLVRLRPEVVVCAPWETRRIKPVPLDDLPEPRTQWFPSHWFCPRRPVQVQNTMAAAGAQAAPTMDNAVADDALIDN
uniref:KIB1-4 beta-propeller domain-containing protein n=1 Tax=Oryza punctata TaxID=4537 RepID=A0A0E0M9U2_ORYPU